MVDFSATLSTSSGIKKESSGENIVAVPLTNLLKVAEFYFIGYMYTTSNFSVNKLTTLEFKKMKFYKEV